MLDTNPWGPEMHGLRDALPALPPEPSVAAAHRRWSWVPPDAADTFAAAVPSVLATHGLVGEAFPMSEPGLPRMLTIARRAVRVLSLSVLALGATSVLNVGVVTVRQRVREVGIRRAPGASSSRVPAAVALEGVCATALAGLVGVALAVALVVDLPLDRALGDLGILDVPPRRDPVLTERGGASGWSTA